MGGYFVQFSSKEGAPRRNNVVAFYSKLMRISNHKKTQNKKTKIIGLFSYFAVVLNRYK